MIASTLFTFGSSATLWTIGEIFTAFCIFKEFLVYILAILLATYSLVPGHTAFKAHFKATVTDTWPIALTFLLDVRETARHWAPFELWV